MECPPTATVAYSSAPDSVVCLLRRLLWPFPGWDRIESDA